MPSLAFETMYQYIDKVIDQADNLGFLSLKRKGNSWYNRVNASLNFKRNINIHTSYGCTYSEFININNKDTISYTGNVYRNLLSPDFSIGMDWRLKPWISLNSLIHMDPLSYTLIMFQERINLLYLRVLLLFIKVNMVFLKVLDLN